jgi:hypothetical protein
VVRLFFFGGSAVAEAGIAEAGTVFVTVPKLAGLDELVELDELAEAEAAGPAGRSPAGEGSLRFRVAAEGAKGKVADGRSVAGKDDKDDDEAEANADSGTGVEVEAEGAEILPPPGTRFAGRLEADAMVDGKMKIVSKAKSQTKTKSKIEKLKIEKAEVFSKR